MPTPVPRFKSGPPAEPGGDASTSAGLDLLRGLLAVLVLASHAFRQTVARTDLAQSDSPGLHVLQSSLGQGLIWVMGFFVISGFCIHLSISRSLSEGTWSPASYFKARWTRIYPLFLTGIALCLLTEWLNPRPELFSWAKVTGYFFMTQGITGYTEHFAPSWSLTNECLYYLAWPLLLVQTGGRAGRALTVGLVATLTVTAGLMLWWVLAGKPAGPLNESWTVTLRFVVWLGGAALCAYHTSLRQWWDRLRHPWLVLLGLFCAFLTVYTWFWMHSRRVLLLHALEIVVVAGFAGVILALARLPWLATPAWRRFCTWMGWLSYPLYLFHQPLLGLVDLLFLPGATFAGSPVWQAGSLFFIAPLAVTALLGIPLEKRLLRWRREALGTAPRKLRP